jgi:hypothetical protein
MPERRTAERAKSKLRHGRSPSTAAGEFVREEIHHVREGKHGARSSKQAIAIGLSKARRAGVPLKPPKTGSRSLRNAAARDLETGQHKRKPRSPSRARSRATSRALKHESRKAASYRALAAQGHSAAKRRQNKMRRGHVARLSAQGRKGGAGRKAARSRARR